MTTKHSQLGDNGGRCESCNDPKTEYQPQWTVPVYMGGGIGLGTMWACASCRVKILTMQALRELLERIEKRRRA